MSLKNKRILITAGPTWVSIDSVRVIGNIATGETGILLAEKLQNFGARVTLLLGPVETCCLNKKIRLIHFKFFDELRRIIAKELTSKKYDIVIQTAAVSDYRPQISFKQKVKSGIKQWRLNLVPTPKIIDLIKKVDRIIYLVGFKFEPEASRKILIDKTRSLMNRTKLDLAVANTIGKNGYQAYIVSQNRIQGPMRNKKDLVQKLIKVLSFNCPECSFAKK